MPNAIAAGVGGAGGRQAPVRTVPGTSASGTGTVVLAAVDDADCPRVLVYAHDQAKRRGLRLRA